MAEKTSLTYIESILLLTAFAAGVLQRRGRPQQNALSLLLWSEAGLLLFFALYAIGAPPMVKGPSGHLQIVLLAVAMGLQAVLGQTISNTTIVFTTTLTKLVGTIAESIAYGDPSALREVKMQSVVVVSYLFGALLSGALIVRKVNLVVFLPILGVAVALLILRNAQRRAT